MHTLDLTRIEEFDLGRAGVTEVGTVFWPLRAHYFFDM